MEETTYLKIECPHCEGHVEFPAEMRGDVISCPHCESSLTLELPEPVKPAPPAPATTPPVLPQGNLYQRLRALNNPVPAAAPAAPAETTQETSQTSD